MLGDGGVREACRSSGVWIDHVIKYKSNTNHYTCCGLIELMIGEAQTAQ